jgi:hypothetical protein
MGFGQHKADEVPELHPDIFVRCVLGLATLAVLELGGILLLLWEKLK